MDIFGMAAAIPSRLTLEESQVTGALVSGIAIIGGSSATVRRSEVSETKGSKGKFGDGLSVQGQTSSLALADSLVQRSRRAGLFVHQGGGSARRSLFRGCTAPVYLSSGAPFSVAGDNVFQDNKDDAVGRGTALEPSKLPDKPPSFFK